MSEKEEKKEKKDKKDKKEKKGEKKDKKEIKEEKPGNLDVTTKESIDAKSKKDKDVKDIKESNKKSGTTKMGDQNVADATLPIDPNAPPPLDVAGNPICVQQDPKPTFAELWFDDPVEGEAAQKLALELRSRIELKALSIRKFLEGAVVPLLLQGLQHMVLERPTNPAEYLAAFLLRNNPLRDIQYVEPPPITPETIPPPYVEPPKCSCCMVHCPPPPPKDVPEFFRKGAKFGPPQMPNNLDKPKQTQEPKKVV